MSVEEFTPGGVRALRCRACGRWPNLTVIPLPSRNSFGVGCPSRRCWDGPHAESEAEAVRLWNLGMERTSVEGEKS